MKALEAQLVADCATRYRLAAQHVVNPNPDKGLLDPLPVDIVAIILEELLIKDHALHLNDLLVKPRDDNTRAMGRYHLAIRRGIGGYNWYELEEMPSQHVLEGKFVYSKEKNRWGWTAKHEYAEMWNVLNTCKLFREVGLPMMLSKNIWVLSPVWMLTKDYI